MKTEFLDMLLTRRSVRAYKPDPVPTALLEEVLRAGTYAPTGGGRQSPVLVAVTDKAAGGSPRCSSPSRTRRRATRSPA